jgi:putative SOS response-associated peptidase YedK
VSKVSEIEERFGVKSVGAFPPNYNIGPGSLAPVITDSEPKKLQFFKFGLTPQWAKKQMYLFNARAEGDHNKSNDPNYTGAAGIITKPAFRKAIRSQRCLVVADAFIEGSTQEKLDKPYVVHLGKQNRPFAFAGIWDEWADRESGEIIQSFAIITTTPNELLQKIPHHRSPVVLNQSSESIWLNPDSSLSEITALLRPFYFKDMNAYPISREIKNPRNNYKELLAPIGDPLIQSKSLKIDQKIVLEGMGFSRGRQNKLE